MFDPNGPTFFELAHQALSSTEHGYDLLAPKFDYTPFRTPDWVIDGLRESITGEADLHNGIDLCCGTGAGLEMLCQVCDRRVVGIDFSQGMLEQARANLADIPGPQPDYCRGDVLNMPFEGEFDLAVCFGAFGHVLPRNEPKFVEQIAKVLRPGGIFAFASHEMPTKLGLSYWMARGFNAAMHVRNALIRPHFIMYYLTFLLPNVIQILEQHGFDVEIQSPFEGRRAFFKIVIARKRT